MAKLKRKQNDILEIQTLGLNCPPSTYRNAKTGIRCPPPCTRIIETTTKGKWCGRNLMDVLKEEFNAFDTDEYNQIMVNRGLIRVNGVCIPHDQEHHPTVLKNMDTFGRVVHWHEPPVVVPETISVTKQYLPNIVRTEWLLPDHHDQEEHDDQCSSSSDDFCIYICDKPASVPVHPAGPYLCNSMTIMVESQMNMTPRSLFPCHRIDRVTSGLVLCCTSSAMVSLFQRRMDAGAVSKLYLACVKGKFPDCAQDCHAHFEKRNEESFAAWTWCCDDNEDGTSKSYVQVDAPIQVIDVGNGIKAVRKDGKLSVSKFQFLSFDENTNTSILLCSPITGRSHQLRVHLQYLGFPIHNDVQYGGCVPVRENETNMKSLAVESVINAMDLEQQNVNILPGMNEGKAAKEICPCCSFRLDDDDVCRKTTTTTAKDRIMAAFSPSQLLEEGFYSIALHALKYRITFQSKQKKKNKVKQTQQPVPVVDEDSSKGSSSMGCPSASPPLATMEFGTPQPPLWADHICVSDLNWL